MKIDEKKREEILKKLSQGDYFQKGCLICGHKGWGFNDTVFEMREFCGGGLVVGNIPIYPVILVNCDNCGYTHFFNAITLGAIESNAQKKDSGNE